MRVLHLAGRYLPHIGGSSLRLQRLLETIVGEAEFHVLVPRHDAKRRRICSKEVPDSETLDGINVHRVEYLSSFFGAIHRICRTHKIDLLHAHNPRFIGLGRVSRPRQPMISEIRAPREIGLIGRHFTGWLLDSTNRVITLSQAMRAYAIATYGLAADRVHVIYNGAPEVTSVRGMSGRVAVRERLGLRDRFVLGYAGTFYGWQGVLDVVEVFSHVERASDNARLLLVGDGPEKDELLRRIGVKNLMPKVVMLGETPASTMPDILSAMDVFLIPRPSTPGTETAVPLKLLEAMSAGIPVVASSVGGLREVLKDGVSGVICAPGAHQEMAKRVLGLMNDEEMRDTLSRNAQERIRDWPSWKDSGESLLMLYRDVLKERARRV